MAALVLANDPNVFNVLDYGADPKHFFDSTAAFQAAFCAAILAKGGTVYIPAGEYIITDTIKVYCLDEYGVNVIGASGSGVSGSPVGSTIDYQGPDGTACFAIQGMNFSYWRGIGVNLGGTGRANQVAFDFQVGQDNVPVLNQGNSLMECLVVNIQGTGGGHIGFRLGQYNANTPGELFTDQGSNISGITLMQCTITGDYQGSAPSTSIGVQFGGSQVKPNRVLACVASGLGCDYLVGSIATLLSASVSATQNTLPVYDVTLFKPNGSNTRYAVIDSGGTTPEICTYTGVSTNAAYAQTAPSLYLTSGTSNGAAVYVVFTYVDADGETTASPQSTLTPTTSQVVNVTSPAASGQATGYNVYVGSASGGPYYLQNTGVPNSIGTAYTIPGTPISSGKQPPVLNTTGKGATGGSWGGTLTGVTRGVLGTTPPPSGWPQYNTVVEYQPNVGVYPGADDILWEECGGGTSLRNFYIQSLGGTCFAILGGRWEALPGIGQRFLQTGYNASQLSQSLTVQSAQLDGFTPPTDGPAGGNGVIWLTSNINLEWIGGAATPQTGSYNDGTNGYFLTNNSYSGSYGAVNFRNFIITASTVPGEFPPWNITSNWPVNADLLLVQAPGTGPATSRYRQIQMASPGELGFFGVTPAGQQTMGAKTAGSSYGSNEQNMLQTLWNVLRAFGLGN